MAGTRATGSPTSRSARCRAEPDWPVLRETLIAWAESGFHLVRAAARPHIHRNTLIYRLDKAGTRTGRNPRELGDGLRFYLACLTERLEP